MAKVRRLLIEVIGDKGRWEKFALKVKQENIRRPAFQEEFARGAARLEGFELERYGELSCQLICHKNLTCDNKKLFVTKNIFATKKMPNIFPKKIYIQLKP